MKKIKAIFVIAMLAMCFSTTAFAATPQVQINDGVLELKNIEFDVTSVLIEFDLPNGTEMQLQADDSIANAYVKCSYSNEIKPSIFVLSSEALADSSNKIVLGKIFFDYDELPVTSKLITAKTIGEDVVYSSITIGYDVVDSSSSGSSGNITVVVPDGYYDTQNEEVDELTERYNQIYKQYTDISSSWAKESIAFVIDQGYFSGVSTTKFSPSTEMTRSMFVTVLGKMGNNTSKNANTQFTDVSYSDWYSGAVAWAVSNKITSGTTTTTFSPLTNVTREQMAVFLYNYMKSEGITLEKVNTKTTFADNSSISSWAVTAVYEMQQAGVISGKTNNMFDPSGEATREEVATLIRKFVEKQQ